MVQDVPGWIYTRSHRGSDKNIILVCHINAALVVSSNLMRQCLRQCIIPTLKLLSQTISIIIHAIPRFVNVFFGIIPGIRGKRVFLQLYVDNPVHLQENPVALGECMRVCS